MSKIIGRNGYQWLGNQWLRIERKMELEWGNFKEYRSSPQARPRLKLVYLSMLSPAIAFTGGLLSSNGLLDAAYAMIFFMTGTLFGMVVLVKLIADYLKEHFPDFKPASFIFYAVMALVSYVAHGQAVGEVNGIFEHDASAFPHATTAAWAMIIATWTYWWCALPVLLVSLVSVIWHFAKSKTDNALMAFGILFSCLLWVGLIEHQALDKNRRKNNIYQVAIEMDFNRRSHCGPAEMRGGGVVFIGADQRRAIFAPTVVELARNPLSIFKTVEVPHTFTTAVCL